MGTNMKFWVYLLSWKLRNRQLRKFQIITNNFAEVTFRNKKFVTNKIVESHLKKKQMENTGKKTTVHVETNPKT